MIEFLINIDLHFIYLFIFTLGLSFGMGAALLGNVLFYTAGKDSKISRDEFLMLKKTRTVVWFGILLYAFGGLGLFTLSYESMLQFGIFYASMAIATILIVNALAFHFYHLPILEKNVSEVDEEKDKFPYSAYLLVSEVVSVVSWVFIILHHSMYRSDVGFFAFMAMYIFTISVGIFGMRFFFGEKLREKNTLVLKKNYYFNHDTCYYTCSYQCSFGNIHT